MTDKDGRAFVNDYLPKDVSLEDVIRRKERHFPFSSSDISRYIEISIQKAINDNRGSDEGGVYMDFVGRDFNAILADKNRSIAQMWPLTYEWYKGRGVDLYRDKVQIACSAHAINGGLYIDANAESNIRGLYAAGEVAAGPHGADRLGGNMAMTCQVFGRRAGRAAAVRAKAISFHREVGELDQEQQIFLAQFRRTGAHDLAALRKKLQTAANRHLLVVRTDAGLKSFLATCTEIREMLLNDTAIPGASDLVHALELNNLCEVGVIMAKAALARTESRGSHYREDFPLSDKKMEQNIFFDVSRPQGQFFARFDELKKVA